MLTSQDRLKDHPRAPKPPQEVPRTLARPSEKNLVCFGCPPRTPPRTPEGHPKTSQGLPRTLQALPSTHHAPPRTPQATSRTPEDLPRTLAGPPMTCRWARSQSGPAECAKRLNKYLLQCKFEIRRPETSKLPK